METDSPADLAEKYPKVKHWHKQQIRQLESSLTKLLLRFAAQEALLASPARVIDPPPPSHYAFVLCALRYHPSFGVAGSYPWVAAPQFLHGWGWRVGRR